MKKKILIVEDDLDLNYIVKRVLQLLRYDFIVATNGEQGLAIAFAQLPDLILLDMGLPGLDGLEVARLIRHSEKTHSIPILAMTGNKSYMNKEKCLQNGCSDFISKPLSMDQLASRIEKLLN